MEVELATYEQAERVRDIVADTLLDGVDVVSVGIRNDGVDYRVGVTATRPVTLPPLPRDLRDVAVNVVLTSGRARRQNSMSGGRNSGLPEETGAACQRTDDPARHHPVGSIRRWWNRSR